ncbi:NAD+ diphosphatase [Microbacterium resistens]|uniref:NAD(+) diphosphatase n=1 Tax=Microbacterium resistens TaxID=156977 RepID=A0ABU1S7G0_9MICO|nr:NAD(+) diphosphatase [Microbacterium resistens]MDR6865521.1 NAD+ diphosphatase [Microbacterium resistens]
MIATDGVLDRAGGERDVPGLIERLRSDPATRVLAVRRGRTLVAGDGGLRLLLPDAPLLASFLASSDTHPAESVESADEDVRWALLGRRSDGSAVLLASLPDSSPPDSALPDSTSSSQGGGDWAGIRDVAAGLPAEEAELLVTGVALAGWLRDAAHCPFCGRRTEVRNAGWARHCPGCGREHFPRTDPAVIVAIESADGERLLLGANAIWQGRMYSCFAGFVEAGESLETTVHREIGEEAGVRLRDVRYRGSQPWPFPRSLMIGFRATAVDEALAHGDGEEIIDVRWLTRAEIGSALAGHGPVELPGAASIARALIRDWYEERA